MAWTKTVFVVEDDVDVHDLSAVMGAVWKHCKPSRDIEKVYGAVDILDHSAARFGASMKLGFDATTKVLSEDLDGDVIEVMEEIPSVESCERSVSIAEEIDGVLKAGTSDDVPGWLFVQVDRGYEESAKEGLGRSVLGALFAEAMEHRFVVVVGRDVDITNHHEVMFHWVANSDFARDAVWDRSCGCDRVGFIATSKTSGDGFGGHPVRAWPPLLERCVGVVD